MAQSGPPTAQSVNARLDQHESICAERYSGIMLAVDSLKGHVSLIHRRAWAAACAIIALLSAGCIGMIGFIFAKLMH